MKNRCARHIKGDGQCDINIDTLIERFKKIRALNCTNPYDVGLDGYVWKKFIATTRAHLVAKMF
jgi:hypothetical protein